MALELSEVAKAKSQEPQIFPHLIMEIEGVDYIFGGYEVRRVARIGDPDLLIGDDWKIGGGAKHPYSMPYIDLTKSSKQLTQQLQQDKGGSGSIGALTIEVVDLAGWLTEFVSTQVELDLLSRKADIYFGFKDTSHPDDSVKIISGVITQIEAKIGSYIFTVQHPEIMKKTQIFRPGQAKLTRALTSVSEEIYIDNGAEFPVNAGHSMFVKINDEWIRYFDIAKISEDEWKISSIIRAQKGTVAAAHEIDDDVSSGVGIKDNLVPLALMIMCSGADYTIPEKIISINQISPNKLLRNAVLFSIDIVEKHGIVVGDYLKFGHENYCRCIKEFGKTDIGYYLVIDGDELATELTTDKTASFKSKYNIWDEGCGIPMSMIDVAEHEKIQRLFSASLLHYDFFITEEVEAQELINEQIYFPSGLYQLPRKGRVSVGITRAPVMDEGVITIDSSCILNAQELSIVRSTNKYFYNSAVYKYEYNNDDDKFLETSIHYSADSEARIKTALKTLTIEARGIRRYDTLKQLLDASAKRFLNRYQFAAESISKVKVNFKTGFRVEIGDIVLFGDSALNMADMKRGTRSFSPRQMEVVNRQMDLISGNVILDLLDTSYKSDARYGVVAPSSVVESGTKTSITFGKWPLNLRNRTEQEKWGHLIGQHIQIRSADWSRKDTALLLGFPDSNSILFSEISFIPQSGDIVTLAPYSSIEKEDRVSKSLYCYINPSLSVVNGISQTQFTVTPEKVSRLQVGAVVIVHKNDQSIKSEELKIIKIEVTTVTIPSLGFIPDNTFRVNLIGFPDGGAPYRIM